MNFDYPLLEEKLKQLPPEMQHAIVSPDTAETVKKIGTKYGLKLDQDSVIFDQTAYLMLGLIQSEDFVRNISKEAQVDEKTARAVAQDVNNEIFGKIKEEMRLKQEQEALAAQAESEEKAGDEEDTKEEATANTVSSLERVGGFTIEKEIPATSGTIRKQAPEVTSADRSAILAGVEDPQTTSYVEPLVDHLLGTSMPQQVVKVAPNAAPSISPTPSTSSAPSSPPINRLTPNTQQPATKQSTPTPQPPAPPIKKGPDPYREPIDI